MAEIHRVDYAAEAIGAAGPGDEAAAEGQTGRASLDFGLSRLGTIDADPGAGAPAEDGEIESFNRLLASYRRLVARIEDGTAFPTSGSRVIVRRVDLSRLRWSMASCELELRRLCRKRLSVVSRPQPLDDQGGQV